MEQIPQPSFLKRLLAALFGFPAGREADDSTASVQDTPDGLVYLYSETSVEEAALTRQLLANQGFHVEYVPEKWNGMYGRTGSPDIYVRHDEVQAVLGFLKELRFPDSEDSNSPGE